VGLGRGIDAASFENDAAEFTDGLSQLARGAEPPSRLGGSV